MFNAFELLNLPVSFDVDLGKLEKHYEQAQKCLHPDTWGMGPSLIKQSSQGMAACVTQAYQVLKDPIRRGEQVLTLKGYWPLPEFPDLMEEILAKQELHEMRKDQTHEIQWESDYAAAYKELIQAFDRKGKEDIQRAYWWFLHVSRGHTR